MFGTGSVFRRAVNQATRDSLVIVGNGMAAARLVDEVTQRAPGRYQITVIGTEPTLAYNRVLLSSLLAGDVADADIELRAKQWWDEREVTVMTDTAVIDVDTKQKWVRLRGGNRVPYTKLVLATGSEAIRLPLAGSELPGVLTFRDKADVGEILARAKAGTKGIVIGGGLLGLEAAAGLNKAGVETTIVHLMDRLMERQLDPDGAEMLRQALVKRGIRVELSAESAALQGRRKVGGLRLKDGRTLEAQMVVMAVGIKPRAGLARGAGIGVGRGIQTNDQMQTSVDDVFAIGECAEHRGICYGLVEPAYEQARVLAEHLAGEDAVYEGSILSTNLKVSGIPVFSAGEFLAADGAETVVLKDPDAGMYRKLIIRDDRLIGTVLVGDTDDGLWYLELIRSGAPLGELRDTAIFGRAFGTSDQEAA